MSDDPTRPIETPPPSDQPDPAGMPVEPATAGMPVEPAPAGTPAEPAPAGPASAMDRIMAGSTRAAGSGGTRLRWAIALGVAGLAVVVAIGVLLAFGSRPAPEALKYIPADSAFVAEVRMDLPGDQLQKLGNLLAHFPGFLDQATLPDKIDEAFSRLVGSASAGEVDYRADIKPWLSGPAFLAFRTPGDARPDDPSSFMRGVASLTTTGTVSCNTAFRDQTVTHEAYRGLDLVLGNGGTACVIDGRQALVGDSQSVHAALDAHIDGKGLDKSDAYRAARAALQGDQLATVFINGPAYSSFFTKLSEATAGMPGMPAALPFMPGFPEWLIEGVRAEDDVLLIDTVSGPVLEPTAGATTGPSLLALPPAHASVIAPLAPANTVLFVETQGAGVNLQNMFAHLGTFPELAPALQMLNGAGGAGPLVGWIEDAGVIVLDAPDGPTGGIALVAADDAAALQRVQTITGLIAIAGLSGSGIQTRETTIGGVTVTTVAITDLGSLVPPGQLPEGLTVPSDATIEFSIAAKGRIVLLGTGESFMTGVLTVPAGAGLVDQALYKKATARALTGNSITAYVGIRDIVAMIEKVLPADAKARWETEVKPYVAPFEALSFTGSGGTVGSRSRFTITVSTP
jgi:hypothetical protein